MVREDVRILKPMGNALTLARPDISWIDARTSLLFADRRLCIRALQGLALVLMEKEGRMLAAGGSDKLFGAWVKLRACS